MNDQAQIRRTLELAERGRGLVSPNPLVGAVVVSADGVVSGEGWHVGPGHPHAEPLALDAAGEEARGGTLYVSLEPCNHSGRTPPCTEAIIRAGISRVVVAVSDPHPLVDGAGLSALRVAGVSVEMAPGQLANEAARQNAPFFTHVRTGRPLVILKTAATLDGKIAARDGSSTWITSEASREEVHRMRAAADAVMVGSGTVIADDPRLTARDPEYRGEPVLRVVLDARARTPVGAHVLDDEAPTLIVSTDAADRADLERLRQAGADLALVDRDPRGGVDLGSTLALLGKRDVQSVLLEGGPTVAGRAVEQGLVDRFVLFSAPTLLGGREAPGILGGEGASTLADAIRLTLVDVRRVGSDVRTEADVHRDR